MAPTPEGKAVVASPSLPGLPPMPPKAMLITPKSLCLCGFACGHAAMGAVEAKNPDGARAFGLHLSGQRLGEAAEHGIGQHLADDMARGDRRGPCRINAGAGFGDEIKAGERADVVGHMGCDHRLEAEDGIGVGIGARAIDAVDRSGRRAGEIDGDLAVLDGELRLDGDRTFIAVERHVVGPFAFGHGLDGVAGAFFGCA